MNAAFLFLTLVGLSVGQYCPPPEVMHPCFCSGDLTIRCSNIQQQFNLKEIFDNAAQHVDVRTYYTSLTISETSLVEIEDGAIEQFRFGFVNISGNPNLEYISPRAFNAGRNDTQELELRRNNFRDNSIFEFIAGFQNLRHFRAAGNGITSIPDHAFQNMPFLEYLYLFSDNISSVGSQAFAAGSDNLVLVSLYGNSIPSGGLREDAFDGINSATFSLSCNPMEFMEQKSYQGLLNRAGAVFVGDGCPGEVVPPRRFSCDQRSAWMCEREGAYRPKLFGFRCKPESGFESIWDYCAARNNNL